MRILVVEDESGITTLARVGRGGYAIDIALTGKPDLKRR